MSAPGARRFVPTQNKDAANGNDVMAELQALLRGRRATTEKGLGSPRAQRKVAAGGKSNSVSEKRFNSVEKLPTNLREADNASPLSPGSNNTKWHVPPPKKQLPVSGSTGSNPDLGTKTPPKRPIHPPLKSSPIPIPGTGSSLIPDPGLTGSESTQNQHKALAFTSSVGAVVNMSVSNSSQANSNSGTSGQRAALTQSLPKSNRTRIGPPPDAPPPRLLQQGTTTTAGVSSSSPSTAAKTSKSGSNGDAKKVQTSKQTSSFPPKLTQKTSNITFNEPVKVTKKGAAKKAPLVTTKSSSPVGIKRLLFKKKGNKKAATPTPSGTSNEPKKVKSEMTFHSRPQSPEMEHASDMESDNISGFPVTSTIPTSTSTPAFGYQNVFDDEVFQRRNQHRMEEIPIDKKPKPLPRKVSGGSTVTHSMDRKSALEPYELAGLIREEEVASDQYSDAESAPHGLLGGPKTDEGSRSSFVGSPTKKQSDTMAAVSEDNQPLSPLPSKSRPQSTTSLTKVISPTTGKSSPLPNSPTSPESKWRTTSTASDIFRPVVKMGSRVSLLSDLTKLPLFEPDPGLSSVDDQECGNSATETDSSTNKESTNTTLSARSALVRRKNIPKELRRAIYGEGGELDAGVVDDDDYIAMDSFRVSASLNEGNFPMDPRASGYYLKIIAPNEIAGKDNDTEDPGDDRLSSPEPYDEVNLGPIGVAPVIESIKSPEDEYVSIHNDHSHPLSKSGESHEGTEEETSGAQVQSVSDRRATQSPTKPVRRISMVQEGSVSPSFDTSTAEIEKPESNKAQISNVPHSLKYSDVTINPLGSKESVIKRKPSAPKKFSYQLVHLEQGKKAAVEESGTPQMPFSPSSTAKKRNSQEGVGKLNREGNELAASPATKGERKISPPVEVFSKPSTPVLSKVATSRKQLEETLKDAESRLADRPLPRVPTREQLQQKLQKQEQEASISNEEGDEKLYYVTTSSFVGQSNSANPPPLSVSIPAKTSFGRVVWHEYVEIDEEEIERMGCSLPQLPPAQFLRLVPLIRNEQQVNTAGAVSESRWNIPSFNDFDDDISDTCSIDRSDSIESCPYIQPPLVGSPPVVPDRPDNLDELVERKALLQSSEYAYAAVPGQDFGVKWMRFQSSDPRHIRLAPYSASDDSQGYILATPGAAFTNNDKDSGSRQPRAGANQPESNHGERQGKRDALLPPNVPPKTASLLREQRLIPPMERPQSYLIPVFTSKGGQSLVATKDLSKSTGQLSTTSNTRDAATGERMERHKGEPTRTKRAPPPKPKPYKDSMEQQGSYPEGMQVVLLDESQVPYQSDKAESKFFQTLGIVSPSDVALGHTKLRREKSQSTGNLLETSSEFETREKWIDGGSKQQDNTANVATTSSGVNQTMSQQRQPLHIQDRGKPSKQSHKPFRSDAVKRKHRKASDESVGLEQTVQDQGRALDSRSMAVIRQNRDTIVKHLSKALDMESLELDFGQTDGNLEPGKGKISQNENSRGLGDILSELDLLLKNQVFSTEDLLQAIQSRLNIKVNIPGDSGQREKESQSQAEENKTPQIIHDTVVAEEASNHSSAGAEEGNVVVTSSDEREKESGMKSKAFYVNEEFLPRLKSMKMVTYTPPYANHTFVSETGESAPSSQSSDQSSVSDDSQSTTRFSRYVNLDNWIDSSEKSKSSKSDSSQQEDADSESSTKIADSSTEEVTQSTNEKHRKNSAPKLSLRARSQSSSSSDISPKSRRKKLSHPGPSRVGATDSPSRGYQLALEMEEERMYSNGAYGVYRQEVGGAENSTKDSSRQRRAAGQSSTRGSTVSSPRSITGQPPFDSSNDNSSQTALPSSSTSHENSSKSPVLCSSQSSRVAASTETTKIGSDSSAAGSQQRSSMRDSRSLSVGGNSFYRLNSRRRYTENNATDEKSTFPNGVGVFTHRGGILMNTGSGVVIEIPEDAIPQGKKQKIWFNVIEDVFNPLHEAELEASHPFSDSFQFHTGSTEFENYLAGKRERKVQLSPVILIGPADAVLSRPIKIKMPHCLPYRNNSWHLHMLARTQNSDSNDWTELSNTIGLIDLPPKRTGDKSYRKSSYQMHIDYTQVHSQYIISYRCVESRQIDQCM